MCRGLKSLATVCAGVGGAWQRFAGVCSGCCFGGALGGVVRGHTDDPHRRSIPKSQQPAKQIPRPPWNPHHRRPTMTMTHQTYSPIVYLGLGGTLLDLVSGVAQPLGVVTSACIVKDAASRVCFRTCWANRLFESPPHPMPAATAYNKCKPEREALEAYHASVAALQKQQEQQQLEQQQQQGGG